MGVRLIEVEQEQGTTSLADLRDKLSTSVAGVILQNPNIYGCIEDYSGFSAAIHADRSLMIVSANPLSLGLLKNSAEWGADIAIGDTQPFGLPTYFGGPTAGYIAASQKLLRKMPGRIVGQSVDGEHRRAFLLTLQAREQHIRRERATSNICSNQALAALATAVHLSCLGPEGLKQAASQSTQKAHYLFQRLTEEAGIKPLYQRSFFNEFTLVLPTRAADVVARMADQGILAGVPLSDLNPELGENLLTVAVTEKRSRAELDHYFNVLKEVLA
jgi:glycine dehydrogenase subunit 1